MAPAISPASSGSSPGSRRPCLLRYPGDVESRSEDGVLPGDQDFLAKCRTVAVGECTVETGSERQRGRKRRRTQVPAYAVRPVAVVEGYKVLRRDRYEVVQRDSLSSRDSRSRDPERDQPLPAARCEPLGVVGDQAVSP